MAREQSRSKGTGKGDSGERGHGSGVPDTDQRQLISEATPIASTSPTTVRVWEREGLVELHRSPSGYRYFGEQELARLRRIAHLRNVERLNYEGIRRALAAESDSDEVPPPRSPN